MAKKEEPRFVFFSGRNFFVIPATERADDEVSFPAPTGNHFLVIPGGACPERSRRNRESP